MASSRQLNELTARKQGLIAEADQHRQLMAKESARLQRGGRGPLRPLDSGRWWLAATALAVGVVAVRRWRGLAEWLPPLLATVRALVR